MKSDPLLTKAALLAKKRDYEGAFKILKDEEDRYNGSFKYYYLYGIISLHSGSYVEAHEFLQYAKRLKYNDVSTLLGLAVLYLKRMNTVQAVDYYLDVLEKDPKNKIAKNALAVIRKHSAAESLSDWMTPDKLVKLFPPLPAPFIKQKTILIAFSAFIISMFVLFSTLIIAGILPNPFQKHTERPVAEYILSREDRNDPVQTGGSYRYILTSTQVIQLYERSLALFTA
jgi:tetratricopeptide (TPR) repeat protein